MLGGVFCRKYGAAVVVTPTDRDKPRVKSVSIVPAE